MTDPRLDVLRDALIEGRNDAALRLIAEIAAALDPKPTLQRRLHEIQRDVHLKTGRRIELTVHVPHAAFVDFADLIAGRRFEWLARDIEGTTVDLASGIRVMGDLP